MSIKKSIAKLLMVREPEMKLVSRLFLFEFFQGAAVAIYFTSAISLFIHHLSNTDLPYAFIMSSFLLWATGALYSQLEHKLKIKQLVIAVLAINFVLILLFRLFIFEDENKVYLYLLLSFFNVMYLMNNLQFWGLAALLFDVRQSKRLFSVVSAGDIPAKMLGYLAAIFFVPLFGTENLLWLALLCLAISFFMVDPLMKLKEVREMHHPKHTHVTHNLKRLSAAITGNKLTASLAWVSVFSFCCLIVVNYIFYGYVKQSFSSNESLAGFFAVFLFVVRFLTFIVKLILTNRLLMTSGLKKSLLVTPVLILILCIAALLIHNYYSSSADFYLLGVIAIVTDVLRSAIQSPVLLTAMQPLPTYQRLRGHTIIKGLMDPFAFLAMGIVLLLLPSGEGVLNFNAVNILLLIIALVWSVMAFNADKHYLNALSFAIRNYTITEKVVYITDKESFEFLLKRVQSGDEREALSVLRIIEPQEIDISPYLQAGLQHKSDEVKRSALKIVSEQKKINLLPLLKTMLAEAPGDAIAAELVTVIHGLNENEDLSAYLHTQNTETRKAAIKAEILRGNTKAAEQLEQWFQQHSAESKIHALHIAAELPGKNFESHILNLMNDEDETVRSEAIKAAGINRHSLLIEKLFTNFLNAPAGNDAADALVNTGEEAFPFIKNYLLENNCEGEICRKLIVIAGRTNAESSVSLLEECIQKFPDKSDIILPVLFQANIHAKRNEAPYIKAIHENLHAAAGILYKINYLQKNGADYLIVQALQLELTEIRNKCLALFSFLYDKEKIKKAKLAFEHGAKKDAIANALELVQLVVPKEISALFIALFENTAVSEKCERLHRFFPEQDLSGSKIFKNVLFDVEYVYSNWTKACMLYSYKNKPLPAERAFIEPFTHSKNMVLKETAEYILQNGTR